MCFGWESANLEPVDHSETSYQKQFGTEVGHGDPECLVVLILSIRKILVYGHCESTQFCTLQIPLIQYKSRE